MLHNQSQEEIEIDPTAKIPVKLIQKFDTNKDPYYIGKLQFNGVLDFEEGQSFMIFVAEDGCEELQIGLLDRRRIRSSSISGMRPTANGRINIDLHIHRDRNGKTFYIGEAIGPITMNMKRGVFFTVFLNQPGAEVLQIARLAVRKYKPDQQNDDD